MSAALRASLSAPSGPAIEADLRVQHPGFTLDVSLRLPLHGVSVLLGPSGCGKTTVLRSLAGLGPTQGRAHGRVRVGEEVWQDDALGLWRPVHERPIGMVFQEPSLFEHLTVQGNLDYGWRRVPPAQRRLRHDDVIPLLGIGHLLQRRAQGLSGGERQRVAIARALLTSPALLLLDEPLSALDAARKAEVMPCLERLGQTGVPVVHVTHALDEAARLADHLVLMRDGRVQAAGPANELWTRLDVPLAQHDQAGAVLQATVVAHEPAQSLSLLQLMEGGGDALRVWAGPVDAPVGGSVRLRVPARDVSVSLSRAADSSILNILPAVLEDMAEDGQGGVTLGLRLRGDELGASAPARTGPRLLARVTRRSAQHLGLRVGLALHAQVKGVALLRG